MYFKLFGKTFGINFTRGGTTTFAELVEIKPDKGITHLGIFGFATLIPPDRFVKSIGRKVALTNLLNYLSADWGEGGDEDPREFILDKDQRKLIWETYFKTHKK